MNIVNLFSGSRGNCTLVQTNKVNLIIDAGSSMKKINESLLLTSGIDLDEVHIILLTHS